MRKLRYVLKSFVGDNGIGVFLFIEMFLLILTVNLALGEYNSRKMLYDPVEPYISKHGFLVIKAISSEAAVSGELSGDIGSIVGDHNISVLNFKLCNCHDDNVKDSISQIKVIPNDMFDKLKLPLSEGDHFRSDSKSDRCRVIITHNRVGLKAGDIIKTKNGCEIEIAAVLSDPTYIPHLKYNIVMSYEEMYSAYEKFYYDGKPEVYTCENEIQKLTDDSLETVTGDMAVISFQDYISEDEYQSAVEKLKESGLPFIENKDILERSEKILSDDFKKFMPAAFVFGLITLIGILSCSMIGTKAIMRKLSVFYCCGATKLDCALIAVGRMSLTIVLSGISAALSIVFAGTERLSEVFGFVFGNNNITVTLCIVLGMVLISAIAPAVLISRADPRELLTDTSNE